MATLLKEAFSGLAVEMNKGFSSFCALLKVKNGAKGDDNAPALSDPESDDHDSGSEEGFSKEPELNHDQNVDVRDRELQVAGRLKYFLSVWMEITSDRKILTWLNNVILSSLKTPTIPSLQLNSVLRRLQLLVLEETDPTYGQFVSTIFPRKKKNGPYRLILNLKGLNASIEYQHLKWKA